ncbi:uncharacterized protein LOC120173037 [Hibiscus syriacus]|uniref:uncharacterized protein LOC120173037 n=1 Tax=Hibiscus syriacus TaxID=106335 RepID=UPI0019210356|nr:uncharacterized protein LOC120173037 [Hibiscus syriacus]
MVLLQGLHSRIRGHFLVSLHHSINCNGCCQIFKQVFYCRDTGHCLGFRWHDLCSCLLHCRHFRGHINPAVTFGLLLARKLSLTRAVFYIIMQCLGLVIYWEQFSLKVQNLHCDRLGAPCLRQPRESPRLEENFYANPLPGCICSRSTEQKISSLKLDKNLSSVQG